MFEKLKILRIHNWRNDKNHLFQGLNNLERLDLRGYRCSTPFRVEPVGMHNLEKLRSLTLRDMTLEGPRCGFFPLTNAWCTLVTIPHLRLLSISFIQIPATLVHLQSLHIKDCDDFSFLPELPSLGDLTIDHCQKLVTLQLLAGDGVKYFTV
jgi:hypothetical protein